MKLQIYKCCTDRYVKYVTLRPGKRKFSKSATLSGSVERMFDKNNRNKADKYILETLTESYKLVATIKIDSPENLKEQFPELFI